MSARVIKWEGTFSGASLPQISLNFTQPLKGAIHDWVADSLGAGPVVSWPSLVSAVPLSVRGGAPQVVDMGSGKIVRFDGASDFMGAPFTLARPAHTVATVFRFTSPSSTSHVHFGYGREGAGIVRVDAGGATINATGGGKYIVPSPYIPADTSWHVAILAIDGSNSGLNIDGQDRAGALGVVARDGISLGFAPPSGRTGIEYKRVTVIDGALSAADRGVLARYLAYAHEI